MYRAGAPKGIAPDRHAMEYIFLSWHVMGEK
jgi:hypothetical protein